MSSRIFNIGVYLAALIALADQASKWWILNTVLLKKNIYVVNGFLNIKLSWNKGVTFGLFNEFGESSTYIFVGIAVVILLLLLNWLRRADTLYAGLGLGLVMGGAVGNVIDRVRYGSVIDFLDFHVFGYHWYTFNLADSAIVGGVFLLMLEQLALGKKKR